MPAGRPAIIVPKPVVMADAELLARLFRALGDATRLRILELLVAEGELHQLEIVRRLGAVQARVSEHMECLLWCGFVESSIQGRRTVYRVTNPQVPSLLAEAKAFLIANEAQIACCRRIDPAEEES